jgi:signal transduction histidine kinase
MEIKELLAMDKKPLSQPPLLKNTINQSVINTVIILTATIGIIFLAISSRYPSSWILLSIGILFFILIGLTYYLLQWVQKQDSFIDTLNQRFNREISEHLEAEETKKKLEMALLEGQKLQAIGTLAGGIAHDFNNILYAIIGYVEMAREDIEQDTLLFKNLGKVLEASHRGQELVVRILDFGRRHQRYEQKPFPINTIIENVLSLLRPTIPSSVRIQLNDCADCIILGNETQLHQVIVNIINNAVDAMYGEGSITIEINKLLTEDIYLKQFPKLNPGSYCKIAITDTGHGMDQTTLKRIFEPFYTTKEVGKGTGLGLATVHGIMTQHHGEVAVTSQLGVGTTFTLLLPEYQEALTHKENTNGNYSFSGR